MVAEEGKKTGEDIPQTVATVFDFLRSRTTNKTKSNSQLFRDFVSGHKEYKHDSIIGERIAFDLIDFMRKIQDEDHHPDLMSPEFTQFFRKFKN